MSNYPKTVKAVAKEEAKYKAAALKAVREFRASKPWRGTVEERKTKFNTLHAGMCAAYSITAGFVFHQVEQERERGNGTVRYGRDRSKTILLIGKLSVVTYLHEFAHVVFGRSERKACEWSINLYQRMFPLSARTMTTEGHLIVKPKAQVLTINDVTPDDEGRGV